MKEVQTIETMMQGRAPSENVFAGLPNPGLHDLKLAGTVLAPLAVSGAIAFVPGGPGNPSSAEAYTTGTLSIENRAIDLNGDGSLDTVRTEIELGDYRQNQGSDFIRFEVGTGEISGRDLLTEGDVGQFFDNDPATPAGWVMDTPYQGDPYTGTIRFDRTAPAGNFTHRSELNGFDRFGNFTIRSLSNDFNFDATQPPPPTPPQESVVPPTPPVVQPPPVCLLKPSLSMTTPKILPKNRNGKLTITTGLSPDSTLAIDGKGKGNSPNLKERSAAARVEVRFNKPATVANIPSDMIAITNGKPSKKGQQVNMVVIDVPSSGILPGKSVIDQLSYKLTGKAGNFSARLVLPKTVCNVSSALAVAQNKAR